MPQERQSLADLEPGANFIRRHIGPGDPQIAEMLGELGLSSLDELIEKVVPKAIRSTEPMDMVAAKSEREALSYLRKMASRNVVFTSMIGMGYSGCVTPKVILRNVLENPGWYTAYTPYQAEVSQGRLEALLNYQQVVADLTGLELANSSLLDEGTAAAEAMAMAKRVAKSKAEAFFVDQDTHPQTIAIIETRAAGFGIDVVIGDPEKRLQRRCGLLAALLVQYPASSGEVREGPERHHRKAATRPKRRIAVVAVDILSSLCLC